MTDRERADGFLRELQPYPGQKPGEYDLLGALVALLAAVRADERERCAKLLDEHLAMASCDADCPCRISNRAAASAIRAMKEPT